MSLFKKFLAESHRLLICAIPSRYYRISVTQLFEIPIEIHLRNRLRSTASSEILFLPHGMVGVASRRVCAEKNLDSREGKREKKRGIFLSPSMSYSYVTLSFSFLLVSSLLFIPFSSICVILSLPPSIRLYVQLSFHLTSCCCCCCCCRCCCCCCCRCCCCCPLVYFPFPIVETTAQDAIKESGLARKKMTPVGIMESSQHPRGCVRGLHRGFY